MRKPVLLLVLFLSSLACSTVWAGVNQQGSFRQVYYAGNAHTLGFYYEGSMSSKTCKVGHWQATIDSSHWWGPWANDDPKQSMSFPSKDWDCQYDYTEYGEGMALYGSTLVNLAIAYNGSGDPHVLCSRYDLQGQKFLDCRDVVALGASHSTKDHGGYGIAAAEMNGTIYAFTSSFTLVSQDVGHTFTQLLPVVDGLADYEPMDAVTFYPAEGSPKILILLSKRSSKTGAFLIWDGSTTLPLPAGAIRNLSSTDVYYQCGATLLGTANSTSTSSRCSFPAGSKSACVQMILIGSPNGPNGTDNYVKRFEYDTVADTVTAKGSCDESSDNLGFRLWPWFTTQTDSSSGFSVQQLRFVVNLDKMSSHEAFEFPSDFMVPQNHDPYSNGYGWQGLPTSTGGESDATPDDLAAWKSYWSLIGVVLGPPPFKVNNTTDDVELHNLSNVEYGSENTSKIKQTSSWTNTLMFSSGTEGKVGLGEEDNMTGGKFGFDISYKQGWESRNSTTTSSSTSIDYSLGTADESEPDWGTHGYALFSVPVLLTQDTAIYAYDYVFNSNPVVGTYLSQDLITTVAAQGADTNNPPMDIQKVLFTLENPVGDPNDPYNFLTFPQPFHRSTDLDAWHDDVCWEMDKMPDWTVIYGSGTHGGAHVGTFGMGATGITFATDDTQTNTSGQTGAIELKESFTLFSRLHLKGLNETLTSSQTSKWSTSTTTETGYSSNLKLNLELSYPPSNCTDPDWVKNMTIQPYLLQATNTYSAPWIPVNYSQTQPWCITWWVQDAEMCDGRRIGLSQAASQVSGQIGGEGSFAEGGLPEASGPKWSSFSIKGGHMAWVKSDGSEDPIPMTADTFDPALGATLALNSHILPADPSLGNWTREGQVWRFKTRASSQGEVITLKLDFGEKAWSFEGEKLPLSEHFREFDSHIKAVLKVNGKYSFRFDAGAEVKGDWEISLPRTDPQKLEVTKYSGCFGWNDREDKVVLEGKLPETLDRFGDMSFIFNGVQRDIRLLCLNGFQKAFAKGKVLEYNEGGMHLVVDFGKKKWSAKFKKGQFDRGMAPHSGGAKLSVKLGGSTWYAQEIQNFKSTMKLSFKS